MLALKCEQLNKFIDGLTYPSEEIDGLAKGPGYQILCLQRIHIKLDRTSRTPWSCGLIRHAGGWTFESRRRQIYSLETG